MSLYIASLRASVWWRPEHEPCSSFDDGDLRRQLGEGGTPPLRDLRASSVIPRFERAYADLFGRYHETIRPA